MELLTNRRRPNEHHISVIENESYYTHTDTHTYTYRQSHTRRMSFYRLLSQSTSCNGTADYYYYYYYYYIIKRTIQHNACISLSICVYLSLCTYVIRLSIHVNLLPPLFFSVSSPLILITSYTRARSRALPINHVSSLSSIYI